jgi:hypothetical protein
MTDLEAGFLDNSPMLQQEYLDSITQVLSGNSDPLQLSVI